MDSITVRLDEDTVESLDAEASEHGVSRSEYIRQILDRRDEYADLEAKVEELEQTVERLKNERNTLIQQQQASTEIVEYVEEQKQRREYKRRRRQAPIWTRVKWSVFGEPAVSENGADTET